jgi:pimeloyl-ACP methyl ester carboxylesterase
MNDHDRAIDDLGLEHRYAACGGGVRLHYVTAGHGPLVVLLHGFPEFWYAWREVMPRLVRAGFRVVAPDMRGYNLSDKPPSVRDYGMRSLVEDVAELVRACGEERANVVGHDWGAGVAWSFAMTHPEMLVRLAVLNGPHPERLLTALRGPKQLAKSWYMFFFQLPVLPEAILRSGRYARLLASLRDEAVVKPTDAELARYVEAYEQPGALRAMLAYYRAMFRRGVAPPMRRIDRPVLVLWGEDDPHLGVDMAQPKESLVPDVRVERIAGATHWVHHEKPERVAQLLVEFLGTKS